ncbi:MULTISPECIES: hypothetical protein [unclassified Rhizobium]|nr:MULTISPECIES: hypothetical protein [unclassified Rhizobium]
MRDRADDRRLRDGVIFSVGIEADFLPFNAGTLATIGLAERQGLLVT